MQRFINQWQTSLIATLAPGGLSMRIGSAVAARLSFEGGTWYKVTLTNAGRTAWEIVKVTGGADGVLDIERGEEGTQPAEWPAGSVVFIELTAEAVNTLLAQLAASQLAIAQVEDRAAALEGAVNTLLAQLAASQLAIEQLQNRVAALESGNPPSGPDNALVDRDGRTLTDQGGNALVVG